MMKKQWDKLVSWVDTTYTRFKEWLTFARKIIAQDAKQFWSDTQYVLGAIAGFLVVAIPIVLLFCVIIGIVPFIAMLAWNYIAPLAGLPLITFWHALAGVVLLRIILPNNTQTVTTGKK